MRLATAKRDILLAKLQAKVSTSTSPAAYPIAFRIADSPWRPLQARSWFHRVRSDFTAWVTHDGKPDPGQGRYPLDDPPKDAKFFMWSTGADQIQGCTWGRKNMLAVFRKRGWIT